MAQAKAQSNADALALQEAIKAEQDLDKEIAEMKAKMSAKKKLKPNDDPMRNALDSSAAETLEVRNVSHLLHAEVEKRMNETEKVLEALKNGNYQMQTEIQ